MSLLAEEILLLRKNNKKKEAYQKSLNLKGFELDYKDYIALCWTSYDYLKETIQNKNFDFDEIVYNFNRYLNIPFKKDDDRENIIHKQMMSCAIELKKINSNFDLYDFFMKSKNNFGVNYIGYWEQFETEKGNTCQSLMEKFISVLSKYPSEIKNIEDFCNFIDLVMEKFPKNDYLFYHKANILFCNGETEKAEKLAIFFAKKKLDSFWIWQFLGDIYKLKNIDLSISCFCKSLLCKDPETFKHRNHLELARLFYNQKKFDYARSELENFLEIRDQQEWKKEEQIIRQTQEPWFISAKKIEMKSIYKNLAQKVTDIFTENLNWIPANIGEYCFKKKKNRIIYFQQNNITYAIPFPVQDDLNSLENGSSIEIKGELQSDNKFKIYLCRTTQNKNLWSLAKKRIGIINYINLEKKVLNLLFDDFTEIHTYVHNIQSYKIGNFVEATIVENINKTHSIENELVKIEIVSQPEDSNLIKDFSGKIRLTSTKNNQTIGFVDDVFISENLIVKIDLIGNEQVIGKAVKSFDKKKNAWGWSAYELKEAIK